jgi:hypothetical protein
MENNKIPSPILYIFRVKSFLSTNTQYDLIETLGGQTQLTDYLTISVNRGLTEEKTDYWLSPKPDGDWPQLTWLHRTFLDTLFIGYRGNISGKEGALIVQINNNIDIAEVYYFKDHYTTTGGPLLQVNENSKLKS